MLQLCSSGCMLSCRNSCMYKHRTTLMPGLAVSLETTFQDIVYVCRPCMVIQHVAGKCTQSRLLLISFKLFPQLPFLASKSSANVVNALEAMTVSLSQKDVCTGLLSVFNTRLVIQITSAEQWPNANIPVNFSIPDLSTCLIPFQLGSATFRSVTRQGLRREENHGTHYQDRFGVLF